MTIAEATSDFSDYPVLIDKLVCQYVEDSGARVVWRFACQNGKIFLRRESLAGFGISSMEETELFQEDVQVELLLYALVFNASPEKNYDIFQRETLVRAEDLLAESFLLNHELQGRNFLTFQR